MSSGFDLRTNFIRILFSLVAFGFLVQIINLMIIGPDQWWEEFSRGFEAEIPPTRGLIYDRNGNPLATNYTKYAVTLSPEQVYAMDNSEDIADALSRILDMTRSQVLEIADIEKEEIDGPDREIANFVEKEQIDQIALTKKEYQELEGTKKNPPPSLYGVYWTPFLVRNYPEGDLASNVIGTMTEYNEVFNGVEEEYDDLLSGVPAKTLLTNIPSIVDDEEWPEGASLILTIDREIQRTVEEILRKHVDATSALSGTVIVMDPETGDILAMAADIRNKENLPPSDSRIAFPNPAVEDLYEPGSIAKVMTMAAAIDSGMVTPETPFFDAGPETINGLYVKNWYYGAKGSVTMTECMQYSINVCLATLAEQMGHETFYSYLDAFNIGHLSGIDLSGERVYPLNAIETQNLSAHSFGQAMNVAPIQITSAISAVANDGVIMAPRVVRSVISDGRQYELPTREISRPISAESARTVTQMLADSLEEEAEIVVNGYRLAGKTGTAEISPHPGHPLYGIASYRSDAFNASFIGWGPVDDPQFLVYVWLEEPIGDWGSVVAAPVFTEVVKELVVLMDIPPDDVRIQLASEPMRLKKSVNTE